MATQFEHVPHPHIAERRKRGAPTTREERVGINGRVALALTATVGTMWCAYFFAGLALVALPSAVSSRDPMVIIQWLSQTFIQLVMLSVIMVGQNIMGRAADRRSEMTYRDAEAIFHEAQQIQAHLKAQDATIDATLDKVLALEAGLQAPLKAAPTPGSVDSSSPPA